MALPHAVHFVFSKNWNFSHRLFSQRTTTGLPQRSHLLLPTKVWPLQKGQAVVIALPQPEQIASPR